MRGNDFLDKMANIAPEYIEEAETYTQKQPRRWPKWVAVAACVACVALVGVKLLPHEDTPSLPMLTIEENMQGMGFEGYMAHDASELVNANPCDEADAPETLPVYKNTLLVSERGVSIGGDEDAMRATLLDVAERLGLDTENLDITEVFAKDTNDESTLQAIKDEFKDADAATKQRLNGPEQLVATAEGMRIQVKGDLTTEIFFEQAVALPEGLHFIDNATYEELEQVAVYLKDTYADLLGMDHPQVNIHGGDYTYDGQQRYQLEFYEGSEDDTQALLNYHFNRVAFYSDDQGNLMMVRIFRTDLSDKVGDYPIISAEDAQALLSEGHCLTNVPTPFPGEDAIAKVELVYRNSTGDAYYMPYYRFYVEVPPQDNATTNLKTYGAYYVPAVAGEYLTNMPSWDGSFNN